MQTRSSKRAQPQVEAPPEQIKDLAFNVYGWAAEIPDGIFSGHEDQILRTRAWQTHSTAFVTVIKDKTKYTPESKFFRESLDATEHETGAPGFEIVGSEDYVIVGLAYASQVGTVQKQYVKADGDKQKAVDVGLVRPNQDAIKPVCEDPADPPLIVVHPVIREEEEIPRMTKLYVLCSPKGGLCTPYQIKVEYVYYLHQFRASGTTKRGRETDWGRLILAACMENSDALAANVRQERLARSRDIHKLVLDKRVSVQNEFLALTAAFRRSQDKAVVESLRSLLQRLDPDLSHAPPLEAQALHQLADNEELNEEDAISFTTQFLDRWPEMKVETSITPAIILMLSRTMRYLVEMDDPDFLVEYRLLRGFIGLACRRIDDLAVHGNIENLEVEEIAPIVVSAYKDVKLVTPPESAAPILVSEQDALLKAVYKLLVEVKTAVEKADADMADAAGDRALADKSLTALYEEYADSMDMDMARTAFMSVARWYGLHVARQRGDIADMVQDIVELLEMAHIGEK